VAERARDDVDGAAGRKRHQDAYRSRGIGILRERRAVEGQNHQAGDDGRDRSRHCVPPAIWKPRTIAPRSRARDIGARPLVGRPRAPEAECTPAFSWWHFRTENRFALFLKML